MADGTGTCPYRGTVCEKDKCTHFNTVGQVCIVSQGTLVANDLLKDIKKILKDILEKT